MKTRINVAIAVRFRVYIEWFVMLVNHGNITVCIIGRDTIRCFWLHIAFIAAFHVFMPFVRRSDKCLQHLCKNMW